MKLKVWWWNGIYTFGEYRDFIKAAKVEFIAFGIARWLTILHTLTFFSTPTHILSLLWWWPEFKEFPRTYSQVRRMARKRNSYDKAERGLGQLVSNHPTSKNHLLSGLLGRHN